MRCKRYDPYDRLNQADEGDGCCNLRRRFDRLVSHHGKRRAGVDASVRTSLPARSDPDFVHIRANSPRFQCLLPVRSRTANPMLDARLLVETTLLIWLGNGTQKGRHEPLYRQPEDLAEVRPSPGPGAADGCDSDRDRGQDHLDVAADGSVRVRRDRAGGGDDPADPAHAAAPRYLGRLSERGRWPEGGARGQAGRGTAGPCQGAHFVTTVQRRAPEVAVRAAR